jgi:hypothetical protein
MRISDLGLIEFRIQEGSCGRRNWPDVGFDPATGAARRSDSSQSQFVLRITSLDAAPPHRQATKGYACVKWLNEETPNSYRRVSTTAASVSSQARKVGRAGRLPGWSHRRRQSNFASDRHRVIGEALVVAANQRGVHRQFHPV